MSLNDRVNQAKSFSRLQLLSGFPRDNNFGRVCDNEHVFTSCLYYTLCCYQGSQRTVELMDNKGRENIYCPRTTNNPLAYVNGSDAGSQTHASFPNYHNYHA